MNLIFCKHNILHRVLKLIVRVTEKKIMRLNITTKDKSIMYPIKEQTLCQKNHSKHGKRVKMKDHFIKLTFSLYQHRLHF